MPWFPDFVGAVELARRQTRADGVADPVAQYLRALDEGTSRELEAAWPGQVVVHDPRAGEVRGHRQLRKFVDRNRAWLHEHGVTISPVGAVRLPGRAVVELLAHVPTDGTDVAWPVAVVAESRDELSVVFRTYCSQVPIDGRRHVRPAILAAGPDEPGDVVGRLHAALRAADVDAAVSTFVPDGYYREAIGADRVHRGTAELRAFLADSLGAGGIGLHACTVTDDGTRCAVEYTCDRWGDQPLTPQAGLGVYERGPDGQLTAARIYDDIEAPVAAGQRSSTTSSRG